MSSFKKNDKNDPSIFGVVFFALLVALIGAFSGFTLLASVPPKPFESVSKYENDLDEDAETNLLNAHYFRGSKSVLRNWVQKREILLTASNTTVELTDAEINAWVADKFGKPQTLLSKEERPKVFVVPGLPNFFIDATEGLNFSLPIEVMVYGKQFDYLLIGKGSFLGEDPVGFQVSRLRLNEASIPFPVKLSDRFLGSLLKPFYESEEFVTLKETWKKVKSVELVENRIRLNLD